MTRPLTRRTVLVAMFSSAATTGCAQLVRIAAEVAELITEYGPILDAMHAAAERYFAGEPDVDRAAYDAAMETARLTLSAMQHIARGTEQAARKDVAAAFEQFVAAYRVVLAILGPLGVVAPSPDGTVSAPAAGAPLLVPAPEALRL